MCVGGGGEGEYLRIETLNINPRHHILEFSDEYRKQE